MSFDRYARTASYQHGALAIVAALSGGSSFYSLSPDVQQRIAAESDTLELKITDHDGVQEAAAAAVRREPLPEAIEVSADARLVDYVRLAPQRNPRLRARIRDVEALGPAKRVAMRREWRALAVAGATVSPSNDGGL